MVVAHKTYREGKLKFHGPNLMNATLDRGDSIIGSKGDAWDDGYILSYSLIISSFKLVLEAVRPSIHHVQALQQSIYDLVIKHVHCMLLCNTHQFRVAAY